MGSWWVTCGDLQGVLLVSFSSGISWITFFIVAWWKLSLQDIGTEPGVNTSPLSPSVLSLLSHFPIFSSAISRLLGLFQLLGEEVSGRAQPDGIFFHGSREPLHALCSHPALQCPVALGSC